MTLQEKVQEFINYRKAIKKPLREVSIEAFMKKLIKLGNGNEEVMIEVLEQSIANGWQGIFEVKGAKKETFKDYAVKVTEMANKTFKEWES